MKTDTSLTFSWNEIECGFRGGDILSYNYQLTFTNDTVIEDELTPNLNITAHNLEACTDYMFNIAGVNSAGIGTRSNPTLTRTDFARPGSVQAPAASPTSSPNELFIEWEQQILNACPTDSYEIEYELINEDQCNEIANPIRMDDDDSTETSTTITNLSAYSTYNVFITAINEAGPGQTEVIQGITSETTPTGAPENVTYEATSESLSVSWLQPPCGFRGGRIVSYQYTLVDNSDGNRIENDTTETSVDVSGLEPCGSYQFDVYAKTAIDRGPQTEIINIETNAVAPPKPTNVVVTENTETSVTLQWDEISDLPCEITQYKVSWQAIEKPYDDDFTGEDPTSIDTPNNFYLIETLEPSTTYLFEVSAYNIKYPTSGPSESVEGDTEPSTSLPSEEPLPEIEEKPATKTTSTITISLPEVPAAYTYVNKYQIGVAPVINTNNYKREVSTPDFGNCGATNYIAGEVDTSATEFVVGDDSSYLDGLYCNSKLSNNRKYEIYIGYASRLNAQEVGVVWAYEPIVAQPADTSIWPWLAPLIVILTLVPLLILGVYYAKNRNKSKGLEKEGHANAGFDNIELERQAEVSTKGIGTNTPKRATKPKAPTPGKSSAATEIYSKQPDPVDIKHLLEFVNNKKASAGGKLAFGDHYELIPDEKLHSCNVASHEKNKYKNRYANIIAYDHSRVVLHKLDGDPYSDYINANYIDGYSKPKKYIATQGPNSASIWDFWRMVWQEGVQYIVMVTKCKEEDKVKCEQYWPEELQKSETYCDIVVTMISEDVQADYTVRHFEVKKVFDNATRVIKHYHYTSWPDHGTPEYATPLLNFIKMVRRATEEEKDNPIIVHCSAGVGRTGTFIAIENLLEQAKHEKKVDVFKTVSDMRQKRIKMVQTATQYDFIYDALVEEIVCGNTLLSAKQFQEKYRELQTTNQNTKRSGLQQEFEKLQRLSKAPRSVTKRGGMDPVNVSKNRFPNLVPVDKSRPYLMTQGTDGSTNYINAAYLDGHNRKDMFLSTQMPLPNTVGDLWRMMYDYNSYTIVMLNPLNTTDKTMAKYWPERSMSFHGPLAIQFESEAEMTHGIIYRTFKLSNKEKPKEAPRVIRQYVYPDWPLDKEVPTNTKSILNLINDVEQWQQETSNKGKPITVHCIDGVGVSTTYCALTSIVDRLKAEECIDVFQTVKRLRMNRYGAVKSSEQYTFLYAAVMEYINSYSIYENFSHASDENGTK
ncbi:receptor-type tyrosine-protein phosphatase T-like [Amphiura filiformis]|uniref:receptor-type tyrosine-protein phosphatase T-like n=1 Tax=Amphiura filiformis TaxID=82378 RepID=UPI003B2109B3